MSNFKLKIGTPTQPNLGEQVQETSQRSNVGSDNERDEQTSSQRLDRSRENGNYEQSQSNSSQLNKFEAKIPSLQLMAKRMGYLPVWQQQVKLMRQRQSKFEPYPGQVRRCDTEEIEYFAKQADTITAECQKKLMTHMNKISHQVLGFFQEHFTVDAHAKKLLDMLPGSIDNTIHGMYLKSWIARFVMRSDLLYLAQNSLRTLMIEGFAQLFNKYIKMGSNVTMGNKELRDATNIDQNMGWEATPTIELSANLMHAFYVQISQHNFWKITRQRLSGRILPADIFTGQQISQFWPEWEMCCDAKGKAGPLYQGEVYILQKAEQLNGETVICPLYHFFECHQVILHHPDAQSYDQSSKSDQIEFWAKIIETYDKRESFFKKDVMPEYIDHDFKVGCKDELENDDEYRKLIVKMKEGLTAHLAMLHLSRKKNDLNELESLYSQGLMLPRTRFLTIEVREQSHFCGKDEIQSKVREFCQASSFGCLVDYKAIYAKWRIKSNSPVYNNTREEQKCQPVKNGPGLPGKSVQNLLEQPSITRITAPPIEENKTQVITVLSTSSQPFEPKSSPKSPPQVIIQYNQKMAQSNKEDRSQPQPIIQQQPRTRPNPQHSYNNQITSVQQDNYYLSEQYKQMESIQRQNQMQMQYAQYQYQQAQQMNEQIMANQNQSNNLTEKSTTVKSSVTQKTPEVNCHQMKKDEMTNEVVCLKCQQAGEQERKRYESLLEKESMRVDQLLEKMFTMVSQMMSSMNSQSQVDTGSQAIQTVTQVLKLLKPNQSNDQEHLQGSK